jgi:phosphoribosylformimino-5-aminoimidazole carboxamide ribotide isomerase
MIKETALELIWEMRQQIMYPSETIDFVKLEDDERGRHWGLYEDENLISVVSVFEQGKQVQFRKLATKVSSQNRGYGSRLLRFVFDRAAAEGKTKIWCNARKSATALYENFGMKATGESWLKYGIEFIKMEIGLRNSTNGRVMEIIPAIDIIDGKCVRLTQGDYSQKKIYNEHPLEVAKQFEDAGLRRLHLVDLDGAKQKAVKNWKVLETLAGKTSLVIDFGGGISSSQDVRIAFDSGASYTTVGSIAVKNEPEFISWLLAFGAGKFLLGADVKNEMIAIHGWLETTDRSIFDFITHYVSKGIQQLFCTDVSKDGKLEGPSTELYTRIIEKNPSLHFIASGGVADVKDLHTLREIGCAGAIVGKAIYENRISLEELKTFI